jgi:predicted permease
VSRIAFYVFGPCLVFQTIVSSGMSAGDLLRMAGFSGVSLLVLGGVAATLSRALGWSRPLTAAIVLVVLLPNAGNFGLSVSLFAFGPACLAQAGVYFVTAAMLTFTAGVLVASLGRSTIGTAARLLLRVPAVWAIVAALICLPTGWRLPGALGRTVELFSNASIPTFLLVLGMQLHGVSVRGPVGPLAFATGMRLVGGAAVGIAMVPLFGLEDVARQAGVLQSAMPSAVITIVLATEYDAEPAFVTAVVCVTTLLSPLVLTPLLSWLGA